MAVCFLLNRHPKRTIYSSENLHRVAMLSLFPRNFFLLSSKKQFFYGYVNFPTGLDQTFSRWGGGGGGSAKVFKLEPLPP